MTTQTVNPMTAETLQQFANCLGDRDYLAKPFSDDKWTYATDGRILVRVPRMEGFAEGLPGGKMARVVEVSSAEDCDGNWIELPAEPEGGWAPECEICNGTGRACKVFCDTCGCETILPVEIECLNCDGAGREYWNIEVPVGSVLLNAYYLRKLQNFLTGVKLSLPKKEGDPVSFVFHGGDGKLQVLKPS